MFLYGSDCRDRRNQVAISFVGQVHVGNKVKDEEQGDLLNKITNTKLYW